MEAIFLKVLNLSLTAGWIVLAVIVLRLLLKKAPKWISCLLWGIVALRLIMPFSIESFLSLIPSKEVIPQDIGTARSPAINSGVGVINDLVNPVFSGSLAPDTVYSANPIQVLLFVASVIWVIGIAVMFIYAIISYIRLRLKTAPRILYRDNIYCCDNIASPFILGVIKPKIYLPSGINQSDTDYVISHEKAHLKRCDHIIKPLGFLLLSVYWFNPLIWVAYILLCRDIEMACDQRVIKDMGSADKKGYLEALVACSVHRRMIMACPLAFGEVGVKSRIKAALNYKKPAFWVIIVAVIVSIIASVCFLTSPKADKEYTKNTGSELEGLSVEVVSFDGENIEIKWINNTENEIIYGEEFYILKQTNGKWKDCRISKEYAWDLIAYGIKPFSEATHKYKLSDISVSGDGIYRFESNCLINGNSSEQYKAWVQFELNNNAIMQVTERFEFAESVDPIKPNIVLRHNNSAFQFTYSGYSSYVAMGKFEYKDNDLILKTDDGKNTYVFKVKGDALVFDASKSSKIPEYRYSGDSNETQSPVPDGARFTLASADNEKQNPYFNATVLEVTDKNALVEPFSDEEIRKTADKIYVGTDVISTNPVPDLKKGMQIRVVYNGMIQETYPASISGVFAIYELDDDGEVIFESGYEVKYIFDPVEICYSNGMYSYVADVDSLSTYQIVDNMQLYEMNFNGPMDLYDEMKEIKLTKENFDSRFSTDMWQDAEGIRQNNKTAWELYAKYGEINKLFILLEQKDGTFYLAQGYYNMGSDNPSNSDDSQIRWVYKLKEVDSLEEANPKW